MNLGLRLQLLYIIEPYYIFESIYVGVKVYL